MAVIEDEGRDEDYSGMILDSKFSSSPFLSFSALMVIWSCCRSCSCDVVYDDVELLLLQR